MIANPQAVLQFGALELARDDFGTPYSLYAAGDDASWGNPDPVVAVVDSLLGDGQLASVVRHNNREAQFGITVSAGDGTALAAAEAALVAETEKQNVLTWNAPDGYAPATVFDVVTSWLEHVFDDMGELRLERRYILHLTLYPHARSATSTTVPAVGAGIDPAIAPTSVVVNAANSLIGWTGRTPVTGKVDPIVMGTGSTYLYQRADIGYDLWLEYSLGSVQDWSATPFLTVDWQPSSNNDTHSVIGAYVSGSDHVEHSVAKISQGASPIGGAWIRSVFQIPPSLASAVRWVKFIKVNDLTTPTDARWALLITEVGRTDGGAANDGTARQLSRSLDIGGSARAMGLIDISHANALGDTLVWSGPIACSPQLRRLRVSGAGELGDTTLVSGAYEDIDTTWTADVPLGTLPSGAYLVMARMKSTSTTDRLVDVTAQTRLATSDTTDVAVGSTLTLNDVPVTLSTSAYSILPLGVLHLPATEVAPGSDGNLRVTLQGAGVRMDEAWLFNITDGDLTFVKGADKVLRICSPSLSDPRWRVWSGPAGTALSDAGSLMEIRGQHLLAPGSWSAFTVTTGAQDAAVSLTYDKRWHTHAGEDG